MLENRQSTSVVAKTQYFSTISANLIVIGYGCGIGWLSMALPLLQSDDSPLETGKISIGDKSWMGSALSLGGVFGNFLFGFVVMWIGARHTIIVIGFPQLVSWLFLIYGTSPIHLITSRFLSGIVLGGCQTSVFLYVTEIADNDIRGQLGTIYMYARNIGILIAYILGCYYSYITSSMFFIGITVVFLAVFLFVPSTPQYLLQKNNIEAAEKSFYFYHKHKEQIDPKYCAVHFERLQEVAKDNKSHSKITWKDIKNSRHGMIQGAIFSLLNICTAHFVFVTYGTEIVNKFGTNLPSGASSIFMGVVQLAAVFVTYILIDRKGRRFLLLISAAGCSMSHAIMVAYLYLNSHGIKMELLHWTPVICMGSVIFMASIGILPLIFICMAESFPSKMRPFGMTFGNMALNSFTCILVKIYPSLQEILGLQTCLMLFSICCALGTIYIATCVEETKGKELNETKESIELTSMKNELFTTE